MSGSGLYTVQWKKQEAEAMNEEKYFKNKFPVMKNVADEIV